MNEAYIKKVSDWACSKHAETNHMYDKTHPYSVHLNDVANAGRKFIHLVREHEISPSIDLRTLVIATCFTHDIIEDARQTFNDVYKATGSLDITEATFVLTNMRGRNRKERANDEYYRGIRENEIASFVKPMDRIANMEFGGMVDMYRKELPNFIAKLDLDNTYPEIADYLRAI